MASILVHIESDGDHPSGLSLQALDHGRRIASALGATLYAHAHLGTGYDEVAWVQALSGWGADRVLLTRSEHDAEDVSSRAGWSGHWLVLGELCAQLGPTLVVMAAGPKAQQIAPRLAASLYSDILSRTRVVFEDDEACLAWTRPDEPERQKVAIATLRARSVVTLDVDGTVDAVAPDQAATGPVGDPEHAGTTRVELPEDVRAKLGNGESTLDDEALTRLHEARIIVTAGAGVGSEEGYRLVEELARALGGEIAATEGLHALGLAPAEHVVAKGVRHVTPTLYVACAASGSGKHLGAIARTATIVAINRDPDAPIFRFATYGVVGEIESVIPTLVQGLSRRRADRDEESSG